MANTIITKNSSTASAVPSAGSLTQGELAVNVTDKKLYTKNSGGSVVEITPTNATNVTGTGTSSVQTSALGSGTANSGTYLRGDRTWASVSGGVTSLNGQTGAITNTSLDAIGSYTWGRPASQVGYAPGSTASSVHSTNGSLGISAYYNQYGWQRYAASRVASGTWRCISGSVDDPGYSGSYSSALWVRIS